MKTQKSWLVWVLLLAGGMPWCHAQPNTGPQTMLLDGADWWLVQDPEADGLPFSCWQSPQTCGQPTPVPRIIQDIFPGYHGVAWYFKNFTAPANPHPQGRYLLRFWAADYLAKVWFNNNSIQYVGQHEGGEDPFQFDVTSFIQSGSENHLAVRILNPTDEPINGITLAEIPHRDNYGGITDSVELRLVPALYIEDMHLHPDPQTGLVSIQVTVKNTLATTVTANLDCTIAGDSPIASTLSQTLAPGTTVIESQLAVENPRLWDTNDPYLYTLAARLWQDGSSSYDTQSVRFGFRDFRYDNGYFRLNGKRIYLRGSLITNWNRVGVRSPYPPDLLDQDISKLKAMGFNCVRLSLGMAPRRQLDLCDELGLLAYEETYLAWLLGDSPYMEERFNRSISGMIRRDRNHPSVVMWGLLNEKSDTPLFHHAVASLPLVRSLDEHRMVLLNSGRFDGFVPGGCEGPSTWKIDWRSVPNATHNGTAQSVYHQGSTWAPGQFALHPGNDGEYGVVRWTAPAGGSYALSAAFTGIASPQTTSDIHIFHNQSSLYDGYLNLHGCGNTASFSHTLSVQAGDTIDVVVGIGNAIPFGDTTAVALTIGSHNVATEFSTTSNPGGVWTYGYLSPGAAPNLNSFTAYETKPCEAGVYYGSLSNPGSSGWDDLLSDQHAYRRVPHTAAIINELRTFNGVNQHVLLSEYGTGGALHLPHLIDLYTQAGAIGKGYGPGYQSMMNQFIADWDRWSLAGTFTQYENFFQQALLKSAQARQLGINAVRANPNIVGYLLTGTTDEAVTGLGLLNEFREDKPGMPAVITDAMSPLRWCLFAEPAHLYRGANVHLEAILSNQDALPAGSYPAQVQIRNESDAVVWQQNVTVNIGASESPFAFPVFTADTNADWPTGKYRLTAAFTDSQIPAAGDDTVFYVTDSASMDPVQTTVTLWGNDTQLLTWLQTHGVPVRLFDGTWQSLPEIILVGNQVPQPGGTTTFSDLMSRIENGSVAIFLCREVFSDGIDSLAYFPLANKGTIADLSGGWVFPKDDWVKDHPIFAHMPSGGIMDNIYFREIIPDHAWSGLDAPAEAVAGAISTSSGYKSGLELAVYEHGTGKFVINTLLIRDNLIANTNPAAQRLLRNLLLYAAGFVPSQPPPVSSYLTPGQITATASGAQWDMNPIHTIDLSGLDGATSTMHSNQWDTPRNNWNAPPNAGLSNPHPGTVACTNWIAFTFDQAYPLGMLWIWNFNIEGNIGPGIKEVTIQYSLTGGTNPGEWTTLENTIIPQATGTADYLGSAVADFAGTRAKYVCLSAHSDWGSPYGDQGLSEVRFYKKMAQLTLQTQPEGINTISPFSDSYDFGSVVPIAALRYVNCPAVMAFDHWEGEGIADPYSASTSVVMDQDKTVRAVFQDDHQCGDECHPPVKADLSKDCSVDIEDLHLFAYAWLDDSPEPDNGDLNEDGHVDMEDFSMIAQSWLDLLLEP